jgi:hypothetical protein
VKTQAQVGLRLGGRLPKQTSQTGVEMFGRQDILQRSRLADHERDALRASENGRLPGRPPPPPAGPGVSSAIRSARPRAGARLLGPDRAPWLGLVYGITRYVGPGERLRSTESPTEAQPLDGAAQLVGSNVRVALRGIEVLVTEQLLDLPQLRPRAGARWRSAAPCGV